MKPAEVLAAFLAAYEAKDIRAIAEMLTDDVHLQDWNLQAHGKQAVVAETQKNFDEAAHLELHVRRFFEGDSCAAAQVRIVVNRTVELEVVDTITIDPAGKVSAIRAYKG